MTSFRDLETTRIVSQLCDDFKDLDEKVIRMVAESCEFNRNRSYKMLNDMVTEKIKASNSSHYASGTGPKLTPPIQTNSYDRSIGFIRDGYKILILMRGLPGSGKSTLGDSLLRHSLGNVSRDEFIYSTDDYFYKSGGHKYVPHQLDEAHAWNQRRCFSSLKRGVSPVIIDNTNLTMSEMKVYCVMGVQFGYIIEILEPSTHWALEPAVLARRNSHGVDKQKIKKMKEQYEQNITIANLFNQFKLNYNVNMPQYRMYPAIPQPMVNEDVVKIPSKKVQQLPMEYVHKFEVRSEIPRIEDVSVGNQPKFNVQTTEIDTADNNGNKSEMLSKSARPEKTPTNDFVFIDPEPCLSPISKIKSPITPIITEGEKSLVSKFTGYRLNSSQPPHSQMKSLTTLTITTDEKFISPPTSETRSPTPTTIKGEKSVVSNFDSKAWGLAEDVLVSHDVLPTLDEKGQNMDLDTSKKKFPNSSSFQIGLNDRNLIPIKSDKFQETNDGTIDEEHYYTNYIGQPKNSKIGVSSISTPSQVKKEPEVMTADGDVIHIFDDGLEKKNGDSSTDEDLVELNLGNDLVQQLKDMFGQLVLGKNFEPVIQVPKSLARQLHALYSKAICRQSEYLTSQLKEGEELAMKLYETENKVDELLAMNLYEMNIEPWQRSADSLAFALSRQKLHAVFPTIEQETLDRLLVEHDNNYMQTFHAIKAYAEYADISYLSEPPISDSTLKEMKEQAEIVNKMTEEVDGEIQSAHSYRDKANRHMLKHKELQELARHYWNSCNYVITLFYSELAQKELKKADLANQLAAQCFVRENSARLLSNNTLALHLKKAEEALTSLDNFIDYQILNLQATNKPSGNYFVITGCGKEVRDGTSVLMSLATSRLKQRQINFSIVNSGMLNIKVLKNLPMSSDIEKKSPK